MMMMFFFSGSATRCSASPVGFVGLGNMGGHMARNLIKKGYPVIAFDVSSDSTAALKADGICSYYLVKS